MTADLINSIGLFLDIVGVILLFTFGLPPQVSRGGFKTLAIGRDENQAKKWKRYKFISWIALGFLVVGFSLQIVSNFCD